MRLLFIFLLSVVLLPVFLKAQNPVLDRTNVQRLHELAKIFNERYQAQKAAALEMAAQKGWPVHEKLGDGKAMELMGVTKSGQPIYYITDNLNAAKTVSTDKVWPGGSSGLNLDGTGMTVGEWDEGSIRATHQELVGRVTQKDSPSSSSDHSTHVAGTMLASGVVANAHGMAPAAHLDAYDWDNDNSEMSTASAAGLLLSNHSYGIAVGWYYFGIFWAGDSNISSVEDYKFGFYDTDHSQAWDDIAYNAPYYLILKAAGNDRGEGSNSNGHEVDGGENGYDCIGPEGVAKNILTIGAVNDIPNGYSQPSDVVMSSFSSWGPTDDGRIKPDLVGNGIGVYSCIASGDADYASYDGTSMATPNITGSLVLLQEIYRDLSGGQYMRSATLKGLAIHTADEAGDADGPDYRFGWGLLNTAKAAALIDSVWIDQKEHSIKELTLNQGDTYTMQVTSDGTQPLRATICWTDPAGTPVDPQLDPPDIMLVNDLDLRITHGSTTYYPWKFASPDPNNPSTVATTGDNIRDNVEQVYIASPASGTYTITISHKGTLSSGSQAVSLIMSGAYYSDNSLPVELASFNIIAGNQMAKLQWRTESEIDNLGFNILRSDKKKGVYRQIASYRDNENLKGQGSSSQSKDYLFYDFDLQNGTTYWYKLQDESLNGLRSEHGPVSVTPTASSPLNRASLFPPKEFTLGQNYPNPFNPLTHISYQLAHPSHVSLSVYNARGQNVRTLVDKEQTEGYYEVSFDGSGLASGIYWYRLRAGKFSQTRKMLLLQ